MAIDLTNLVCLITGTDEGIGNALVHGFLRRGARVAAGLLDAKQSECLVGSALPLQMDVTNAAEVNAAVATTVARLGRIDVLINNAGIFPRKTAEQLTLNEWRRIMDLNLDGTWRCCEAVIPHFRSQGSGNIINVGSICLRNGLPQLAHYEASKGGVLGLTRGLARDLGPHGIRVNCIHPGAIQTAGERRILSDADAILKFVNERQCIQGRLTPESIEPVFAFFASPESGDITGQSLTVDRGWVHD